MSKPFTCIDSSNYVALLLVDIEDFLGQDEIDKIQHDVEVDNLSLIVIADWYNKEKLDQKKYYNIVTFEEWSPFMGGSNIATLNSLLKPYHIAFG